MPTDSPSPPEVLGGVLVGGASRRMGRPKALIQTGGTALGERVAAALAPHVAEVLLLGGGPAPPSLADLARVADAALPRDGEPGGGGRNGPGGPLAGILAALRARPGATWVICPCDLPRVEPGAVAWLLSRDRPGDPALAAVLPLPDPGGPPQPLFALYRPAALPLVERIAAGGGRAPRRLVGMAGVEVAPVPAALAHCWRDADTPADLENLSGHPRG